MQACTLPKDCTSGTVSQDSIWAQRTVRIGNRTDAGQISPICAQRTHEWVRPPSSGELDAGARGLAPGSGPGSEEFMSLFLFQTFAPDSRAWRNVDTLNFLKMRTPRALAEFHLLKWPKRWHPTMVASTLHRRSRHQQRRPQASAPSIQVNNGCTPLFTYWA